MFPTRALGQTNEELSVIGFGGVVVMDETAEKAERLVSQAIDRGINHFDTAIHYRTERYLRYLTRPALRDKVFIASKHVGEADEKWEIPYVQRRDQDGVAVLTIRNLLVVRLDEGYEGRTLAEYPWVTDFANSIATPAVHEDTVVITSEYNNYSIAKLKVTREGITQLWEQPYASGVCSPLIYQGLLYFVKNGGIVSCVDPESGQLKYRGRLGAPGGYYASPVAADGRIYFASDRGVMTVIAVGDELNVLARNRLAGPVMATPAIRAPSIRVARRPAMFSM